ncbi:MAG: glycosyltransferase family 4 protein [bacterium]|nr:glycosyltransferase family 4 protein [bacterium]
MSPAPADGVVLHAKFAAYLGWSQPFLHSLLNGLEPKVPGAVLCNRRENRERFPVHRYACASSQALFRPAGAAILAEVLHQAWRPWLLHAHFGWSGIRSLLVRQCLGVPLVTTFGGRDLGADLHDPGHRPLYARLLQASDLCICVSETLAMELSEQGVEDARIRVIRRGADVDFFHEQARPPAGPDGPLRILMVGRIVEKKGHDDAIRALATLREAGQSCTLRIVGAGDEGSLIREAEKHGVAGCIEVRAPTDAAGVRDHFAWADVLLHCSRRAEDGDVEGIPNVVVEAAATGLPIVGTRHGGIPEVVVEGETGRLVPEAAPKALAEALGQLAQDGGLRRAWGVAGARLVRSRFSLVAQLEAHQAAYETLRTATSRAVPLGGDYTREALVALAPAIDADLLVASRWATRHWVAAPTAGGSVPSAQISADSSTRPEASAAATAGPVPLRERVRRLGAAWAEFPVLGVPMRAYRALRRVWGAAAQQREDVRAWGALAKGLRLDLRATDAGMAVRRVVKEGPASDASSGRHAGLLPTLD